MAIRTIIPPIISSVRRYAGAARVLARATLALVVLGLPGMPAPVAIDRSTGRPVRR